MQRPLVADVAYEVAGGLMELLDRQEMAEGTVVVARRALEAALDLASSIEAGADFSLPFARLTGALRLVQRSDSVSVAVRARFTDRGRWIAEQLAGYAIQPMHQAPAPVGVAAPPSSRRFVQEVNGMNDPFTHCSPGVPDGEEEAWQTSVLTHQD